MHAYAGRQFVPFLWWSLVWPGREANSRPTVREADTLPTEPTRHGNIYGKWLVFSYISYQRSLLRKGNRFIWRPHVSRIQSHIVGMSTTILNIPTYHFVLHSAMKYWYEKLLKVIDYEIYQQLRGADYYNFAIRGFWPQIWSRIKLCYVWDNDRGTRHSRNHYRRGRRPMWIRFPDDKIRGHCATLTPINYEKPIARCVSLPRLVIREHERRINRHRKMSWS